MVGWRGHATSIGKMILVGKVEEKIRCGRPRRRWELRWVLMKQGSKMWTVFMRLRRGSSGGFL
jgi:hypothetical protein